jgi:hypothetical protein
LQLHRESQPHSSAFIRIDQEILNTQPIHGKLTKTPKVEKYPKSFHFSSTLHDDENP